MRIFPAFEGRVIYAVIAVSAIGVVTSVCGVTVLPFMAGLLAAGIPLAPVMAFWLSSPVTDPAMLATSAATLGVGFAVGKTLAAFSLGICGGAITSAVASKSWAAAALRSNGIVGNLHNAVDVRFPCPLTRVFGTNNARYLSQNVIATARLILTCLIPAFAAEYALNAALEPHSLAAYVGKDAWWAIPFAVFVGAPAYLDGYAALPLTRCLMDHGMSPGAAMAFLVSGGVVSVWGAMAISPVLKLKPFLLYLALSVSGSLIAGYAFEWMM